MTVETRTVAELEELLAHEIPCGGLYTINDEPDPCGRVAVLISRGHNGCDSIRFKCIQCWQVWYRETWEDLVNQGLISCATCTRDFLAIESFSDYRPF